MTEKPWLIVTFRRSGGTTLSSLLYSFSSYRGLDDEAFNPDRELGHIMRNFDSSGDMPALEAAVADALEDTPTLKHCIDTVPIEVTKTIVLEAQKRGYHIIVLTRRNEARRLASLFLAQATEIWGPEEAADGYQKIRSGEITPFPIDLESVEKRVRYDKQNQHRLSTFLKDHQIEHQHICFEDLFADETSFEQTVQAIIQKLNIPKHIVDPIISIKFDEKNQRSWEIGPLVESYNEMMTLLNRLYAPEGGQ